jgi:hypothetical protein
MELWLAGGGTGVASYLKLRRRCPDAVAGDAGDAGFLDVAGCNQAWRYVSYTDTVSSEI